jgi:uncharacterized protein YxjI
MSTDLVATGGDRYLARKAIFSFFGKKFHVYDPSGASLQYFVHQKGFRLKEAITVYRDEGKTQKLLEIKARSVMDFSGTYDVTDATTGQVVGALKRQGFKSMLRDEWSILDASGAEVGKVMEDSMAAAMIRRVLSNLIPQSFTATIGEVEVASFDQHFNPFVAKFDIDFSMDTGKLLDRRLGIAAVVMLLAIEGRQQ